MKKFLIYLVSIIMITVNVYFIFFKETEGSSQNRHTIIYLDANSIRVTGQDFPMQGFRFMGHYSKSKGVTGKTKHTNNIVSLIRDLGAEEEKSLNNWYAVFATLKDENKVKFKLMPFLRVSTVEKNDITFGQGGEYGDPLKIKEYSFEKNGLNNTDILFITETVDKRKNSFSGRISEIIGNDERSITVKDVGSVDTGDYLLPAPPGDKEYRYLGSFYVDTHEVRNISDDGTTVKTRGVSLDGVSGSLGDSGVNIKFGGFISPLATGVTFNVKQTLSTASVGSFNILLGMDSKHDFQSISNYKESVDSIVKNDNVESPFSYKGQQLNIKSSGSLGSVVKRQIDIRGWIEP